MLKGRYKIIPKDPFYNLLTLTEAADAWKIKYHTLWCMVNRQKKIKPVVIRGKQFINFEDEQTNIFLNRWKKHGILKKPVLCRDANTGRIIERYDSIYQAAKAVNRDHSCISKACRGRQDTSAGYEWEYWTGEKKVKVPK